MICPQCKTDIGMVIGTMFEPCQRCKDKAFQEAKDAQDEYVTPKWLYIALIVILLALIGTANAKHIISMKGLMCDTPEQVKMYLVFAQDQSINGAQATAMVNKKVGKENACIEIKRRIPVFSMKKVGEIYFLDKYEVVIFKVELLSPIDIKIEKFMYDFKLIKGKSI